MAMTSTRAYLESTVMTAGPEQLQLMLYEGAIRFAQQFRAATAEGDFEKAFVNYEKTTAIINELHNGLRPKANPELCEKYAALYDFCERRLDDASCQKDVRSIDEAIQILQHLRQTWVLVMEKIREERAEAFPTQAIPADYVPLAVDA